MTKRNLLMIAVTLLDIAGAAYFCPTTKRYVLETASIALDVLQRVIGVAG